MCNRNKILSESPTLLLVHLFQLFTKNTKLFSMISQQKRYTSFITFPFGSRRTNMRHNWEGGCSRQYSQQLNQEILTRPFHLGLWVFVQLASLRPCFKPWKNKNKRTFQWWRLLFKIKDAGLLWSWRHLMKSKERVKKKEQFQQRRGSHVRPLLFPNGREWTCK